MWQSRYAMNGETDMLSFLSPPLHLAPLRFTKRSVSSQILIFRQPSIVPSGAAFHGPSRRPGSMVSSLMASWHVLEFVLEWVLVKVRFRVVAQEGTEGFWRDFTG